MSWFLIFFPGDARLARNVKNKVFSLDLVSTDPSIIACDMANVSDQRVGEIYADNFL